MKKPKAENGNNTVNTRTADPGFRRILSYSRAVWGADRRLSGGGPMTTYCWRHACLAVLMLVAVGTSCSDVQNEDFGQDAVDGILDVLGTLPSQLSLPASTDPTLTFTDPSNEGTSIDMNVPVTPFTVTFTVTNWGEDENAYPAAGKAVKCFIEGDYDGMTTGLQYTFGDVPFGYPMLTCHLFDVNANKVLTNCESRDSVPIKVIKPCLKTVDCDDGNPLTGQGCSAGICGYNRLGSVGKCVSAYDCTCADKANSLQDKWEICFEGDCGVCSETVPCNDGEKCTLDTCDTVTHDCTYEWIETADGKCCNASMADPDAVCDDDLFCTTDYCNLGGEHCVSIESTDPNCCEKDPDPNCDDGNDCTIDSCLAHECRHGPVADPLCCNPGDSCDDGNPCTDDACVESKCTYTANDLANCCVHHTDCGPGGTWDDEDPSTLDYCAGYQCQHTKDPSYCECVGNLDDCAAGDTKIEFPCATDDKLCTNDKCTNQKCLHPPIPQCCEDDSGCKDTNVCTTDSCNPETLKCEIVTIPPPLCCNTDSECDDENPCNVDSCINHTCRHGPNVNLPDCCLVDADCTDSSDCTVEYCNVAAKTCVKDLVVPHDPTCCWTALNCDDDNSMTIDKCVNNQCVNKPDKLVCSLPLYPCQDNNPCTENICNEDTGVCSYPTIDLCCIKDSDCTVPSKTDGNPCTEDKCNTETNVCYFTPIVECCPDDAYCEGTGTSCTTDTCVNNACKHIQKPGCCESNSDCNDNNNCTLGECVDSKCIYNANLGDPLCCQTPSDCNDGDSCTEDTCVNYFCANQPMDECCLLPPGEIDPGCLDDNACTCDICYYGMCRHLTPEQAPAKCGLPLTCCIEASDCQAPNDPCQVVECVDGNCDYTTSKCSLPLPYTQTFTSCSDLSALKWSVLDFGAVAKSNWKCTHLGPLGPDNHERFDWAPQVSTPFDSFLVSPPLDCAGHTKVTVQFDRYYDHYEDTTDLGLYALSDTDGDELLTAADGFPTTLLWSVGATEDLESDTVSFSVPVANLANPGETYFGFRIAGSNSFNLNNYDLDNVKVCPGSAPGFTDYPSAVNVEWNGVSSTKISALDPDDDELTFTIVSGPSFAKLSNPYYSNLYGTWNVKLDVDPVSDEDIGDHTVVIKVTDGCVEKKVTIPILVVVADGYIVWAPEGAPDLHATTIRDAIKAAGRTVQMVQDLSAFESLDNITGVFVVLGVYGSKHVLTESEVTDLVTYVQAGGKVYMEGGDTWAFDSWTTLHGYFKVTGADDGDKTYGGQGVGKHFVYGYDFDVATDYTVNNFVDQIDPVINSGAIPVLRNTEQTFSLAVTYENSGTVYRTVGASLPFAALVEQAGDRAVSPQQLMALYLDFLENGYPPCVADVYCDDSVQCSTDSCINSECINTLEADCIPCVDDQDCPDDQACHLSSNICTKLKGDRFDSEDTPLNISQGAPSTFDSTIYVPGSDLVDGVNVKVYIQHAYRGDLKLTLSHAGVEVILKNNLPTESEANLYRTWDAGDAVYAGSEDDMTAFDQAVSMEGEWVLTVEDKATLSGGKLIKWSLFIEHGVPDCNNDNEVHVRRKRLRRCRRVFDRFMR